MALTKLTADLDNIQALSDKPNEIEGLTADQLKARFDKTGADLKTYINDTLTSEIDTALSGKLSTTSKAVGSDVTTGTEDTKYVTAKAIKDAAVDLGAWTAYTPTLINITKGDGTLTAYYCRIGKTIHFKIKFVLGSTSAIGTTPVFSLPIGAASSDINSSVVLSDANVGLYIGTLEQSVSNAIPKAIGSSGNYTNFVGITATVPFTWASTDYIQISGTYEAA